MIANKLIAEYKQKELERLADYILNQMSIMEVGLNPCSQGRGIYNTKDIQVPLDSEIYTLLKSLRELKSNILTPEEKELLE